MNIIQSRSGGVIKTLGENVVDFVDFWQPFVLTKASKSIIQSRRHEVVE